MAIVWAQRRQPAWLFQFPACALTVEYGGHHLVTIGFALKPLGQHLEKGVWWTLFWVLHRIAWNKITWMFWGTWDSNPGPNGLCTRAQPTQLHCLIVNELYNKQYIENKAWFLKIKKKARWFEPPNRKRTRGRLLRWNIQGFYLRILSAAKLLGSS